MNLNVASRQTKLLDLENYLKDVDTEVTMILQNLQWDRKHLEEERKMVVCQYDCNHHVPPAKLVDHEKECFLKSQGYAIRDRLLPSPIDPDANTLVKLTAEDMAQIINDAPDCQPVHKTGGSCSGPQPLSLERLQAMYSAAERRALHDAVVARAPPPCALSDLALVSVKEDGGKEVRAMTRLEAEAQLRDLRRRRTRYRVPAKTRNYSAALRDVIAAQMELLTGTQDNLIQETNIKTGDSNSNSITQHDNTPNEKSSIYRDDTSMRSYYSKEGKSSNKSKDRYSESRHSENYENRKGGNDRTDRERYENKKRSIDKKDNERYENRKRKNDETDNDRYENRYSRYNEINHERNENRKRRNDETDHERYENRKRRNDDSVHDYSSDQCYKTKNSDGSRSHTTNQYKDKSYGIKTKRMDDEYPDYKTNKERYKKYEDFSSRKEHREKDYDPRRNSRTEDNEYTSNGADRYYQYNDVSKEKYRDSKRKQSHREKEDRNYYRHKQ